MTEKRQTFKSLFNFLMEKYKENPGKLDVPKYTDIDGVKTVSFGIKYRKESGFKDGYTFVVTNEYKQFKFYKNIQISNYYTKRADFRFDLFKDMYGAITSQYDKILNEIHYNDEEEDKLVNKDTPLEGLISIFKLEGKFDELYNAIYDATNRGYVGQIAINKRTNTREDEIRYHMRNIMIFYSRTTSKSFIKEFGFDAIEKSEELLELMFDKKDIRIKGEEIELYILKFHNF